MDANLWDGNLSAHDEDGALMNIARAHRRKLESKNKCNCCRGRDQRHRAVPLNHDMSIVVVLSLTVAIAIMGGACADEIVESRQPQPQRDVIAPIWGEDVELPKEEGELMPGVVAYPDFSAAAVRHRAVHVDGQLQLAQRKIFRGRTLMMMSVPMKTSGLGDGLVALLVLYIFLLLSVMCFIPSICTSAHYFVETLPLSLSLSLFSPPLSPCLCTCTLLSRVSPPAGLVCLH